MAFLDYLGFALNPIGSAIGAIGQYQANKANAEENQKNREWNEKMWHMNNEYNTPKAVLGRYADVGIDVNPNYLVTGGYNGGLSSYAGNLSANQKQENIAKNSDLGIAEANQMKNQNQMVRNETANTESKIQLNQKEMEKKDAEIAEIKARTPNYEVQGNYIRSLIQGQENENDFFDMTLNQRLTLLELEKSISEGKINLMTEQCNRLLAQTMNDNKLTDARINVWAQTMAQGWQKLKLEEKQINGQLLYWLKMGNAAEQNAKANVLCAITGMKRQELDQAKFDKFSDAQVKLIMSQVTKMKTENAWINILNENNVLNMQNQRDIQGAQLELIKAQTNYMEMKSSLDLLDILW